MVERDDAESRLATAEKTLAQVWADREEAAEQHAAELRGLQVEVADRVEEARREEAAAVRATATAELARARTEHAEQVAALQRDQRIWRRGTPAPISMRRFGS